MHHLDKGSLLIFLNVHWFHVDNNEGESGIAYEMIIGCDLMV